MSQKKRIIVLEDDRTTSHLIAWPLTRLGYDVVEAGEGRTAIDLSLQGRVDLMIADMMLPDMRGSKALQEVIRATREPQLKAVFITSLLSKRSVPEAEAKLEIDGVQYPAIGKPIKPDVIRALVERLIGGPN